MNGIHLFAGILIAVLFTAFIPEQHQQMQNATTYLLIQKYTYILKNNFFQLWKGLNKNSL